MSETKFTPGPWVATEGGWEPWDGAIDISSKNGTIAYTTSGNNERANAHLIAAAPELYECLEFLCAWLKGQGFGCTSDKALPGEYDYAIEVLAKARGESQLL